ncbi:MAG TPA: hypothetical protein VG297_13995 [Bryobacteraceae bacterium]|jgi:hypothetical protein|nr:hypothetical protein [Bryobacteraceae bacterium]
MRILRNILHGLAELMRELSDQNAYQRHLAEHGAAHSAEEWRRFSDERFRTKYQQVKCC